ncbi:hypothetical protein F4778DRAFT_786529 [Xylariomycetidae sp. FL2044]|nr:hypothetical protein F4778DRAFT_786529 [Xylariomycetidae sp. FL2044]
MSTSNSSNTGSKTTGGTASATNTPANAGLGEDKPKAFDAQGAIGKQFTGKWFPGSGALGGVAQKIGGPLDKEGMVGKQFTPEGSLGGTVQNALGGDKKRSN